MASISKPHTKYAKSGRVSIAYQQFGSGALDLVYVPGWVSHIEYNWEEPSYVRFLERLGSFARVIVFDKRGTGLSDRDGGLPSLEERMDDVRAVMDAAGVERAAIFGASEGGNMSALFAATYPERVIALVLHGCFAKRIWSPDYPWAPTVEERQKWFDLIEHDWCGAVDIATLAPSRANDPSFVDWFATYLRMSASPSAALSLARANTQIDTRHILSTIRVPTLVLHRRNDRDAHLAEAELIASSIPEARLVALEGEDHLVWVGDQAALLDEVEEFLTGARREREIDRVLKTILFTDIVGSTLRAADLGDRAWHDMLGRHDAAVRNALARFRGQEIRSEERRVGRRSPVRHRHQGRHSRRRVLHRGWGPERDRSSYRRPRRRHGAGWRGAGLEHGQGSGGGGRYHLRRTRRSCAEGRAGRMADLQCRRSRRTSLKSARRYNRPISWRVGKPAAASASTISPTCAELRVSTTASTSARLTGRS